MGMGQKVRNEVRRGPVGLFPCLSPPGSVAPFLMAVVSARSLAHAGCVPVEGPKQALGEAPSLTPRASLELAHQGARCLCHGQAGMKIWRPALEPLS